jgi:hypothetical protein
VLPAWIAVAMTLIVACAARTPGTTNTSFPEAVNVSQLWAEPADLEGRDLFHGVGGADLAPASSTSYQLESVDNSGYSRGYDIKDGEGTSWSVKTGREAQAEVVASRVLWAIGYHQPAVYLLKDWTLTGGDATSTGPARFRREQSTHKLAGEWSWYENPFATTREFRGLLVANLILNNWDLKTSNNKIYDVVDGANVRRMYVVRDLGASLGKTSFPTLLRWGPFLRMAQGSRNNISDFETQRLIKDVDGDDLVFDYRGVHTGLFDTVMTEDVVWTCRLMARISDHQWADLFRAAGYEDAEAKRFIAKFKAKIAEGLAIARS